MWQGGGGCSKITFSPILEKGVWPRGGVVAGGWRGVNIFFSSFFVLQN